VALRPLAQRTHYALFFFSPLVLCAAISARFLLGGGEAAGGAEGTADGSARRRLGWLILGLGVGPLPVANFFNYHYDWAAKAMVSSPQAFAKQIVLARAVRHFVPQPRSMAVWGWKPSLYVDLGLPPATRSAVYAFLTDGNPNQEFLRAAYMRDLEKSRPEIIVDVEDFVYHGWRKTAPETFPDLASFLGRYYVVAGYAEAPRTPDYSLAIVVYSRRKY
jgi:hypothetical protein